MLFPPPGVLTPFVDKQHVNGFKAEPESVSMFRKKTKGAGSSHGEEAVRFGGLREHSEALLEDIKHREGHRGHFGDYS